MASPHILADITAHGFGHAGMTFPILRALAQKHDARITIRTRINKGWLAERARFPFVHLEPDAPEEDFGMQMVNAMRVRGPESLAAYQALHQDLPRRIEAAAKSLKALAPDLLLGNIPYIPLAGAKLAGVPAIAYSTLNWADVLAAYCDGMEGEPRIRDEMAAAYNSAIAFIQPTPAMPMPSIRNGHAVGPVARLGADRKAELRALLGVTDDALVILVGLGGLPIDIAYAKWPDFEKHRVILGSGDDPGRPDLVSIRRTGMTFVDLVRSCDVIVVKTGYGTVAEAVCNGCPTVHVVREGWPETQALSRWMAQNGHAVQIDETALCQGAFLQHALAARATPLPPAPPPSGIMETVEFMETFLE